MRATLWLCCLTLVSTISTPSLAQLSVTQMSPARNALAASRTPVVQFDFDRPVDPTTINANTFSAFGRWTGPVSGTFQFANSNHTVLFQPDRTFTSGDLVTVGFSEDVRAADSSTLQTGGFNYQFWTGAQRVSNLAFNEVSTMSTDNPSRPYGGIATDLDNNGWLDITMVNEDTADLRVFMNKNDGTGYHDFTQPTYPVGNRASPSEPGDFNRDGFADIAVANIDDNTVSILMGNGDGSFAPQQLINVGTTPRGIAVLDVDGDGDSDVVNTNRTSNNISIHFNDGTGTFGAPTNIDAGIFAEWSLMAADMNNDGLMDLVVGSNVIRVLTSNGDGTFTQQPSRPIGGSAWQLTVGDVNGDGNVDVSTANAQNNNGSILLGNGDGTFQPPDLYQISTMGSGGNGFPLATDLGDVDGDGDLDWITSSFSGDWILQLNDGDGNFTFEAELDAPIAASCSLIHDFDNDGDMDLGLVDEIDNVFILSSNDGLHVADGDFDADGNLDASDIDDLVAAIAAGENRALFDLDGDGLVDGDDLTQWLTLGGAANLPSQEPFLLGDANLDGTVDGTDFLAWNQNKFDQVAAWTAGDFNADGVVDGLDFVAWNANKFTSADVSAVPEPVLNLLVATALFSLVRVSRRT